MKKVNPALHFVRAAQKSRRVPGYKTGLKGNWPRRLAKRSLLGATMLENTVLFDEPTRLRLQGRFLDFWILMKQCERELQQGGTHAQS